MRKLIKYFIVVLLIIYILLIYQKSYAAPKLHYVGKFQLTAYAWTGNPCANGKYPSLNHTVAAHVKNFKLGTKLYIEGYGYYIVEDRGAFPKGVIDIYMGNKAKCIKFGRKHNVKVFVIR